MSSNKLNKTKFLITYIGNCHVIVSLNVVLLSYLKVYYLLELSGLFGRSFSTSISPSNFKSSIQGKGVYQFVDKYGANVDGYR